MINLCEYDNTITESEFKSKVDSMFMMLYIAIMTDNLKRVSHFISDSLFHNYESFLDKLNSKNERQMYDLLNIETTEIEEVKTNDNKFTVTIKLVTKYMDYVVNKSTKQIVHGNNNERIEKTNYLTLEKKRDESTSYTDIYKSDKCDWIITKIQTI